MNALYCLSEQQIQEKIDNVIIIGGQGDKMSEYKNKEILYHNLYHKGKNVVMIHTIYITTIYMKQNMY